MGEAVEEGGKITDLRKNLERERKRRKRYEHYEALATEVNKMKSRPELQAEIDSATSEIARLKKQKTELEAQIEKRSQCAQLLVHGAAELKLDLQNEEDLNAKALEGDAEGGKGKASGQSQ